VWEPLFRLPGEKAGEFVASFLELAFDLAPFLGIAPAEFSAQFLDVLFERDHRVISSMFVKDDARSHVGAGRVEARASDRLQPARGGADFVGGR
jgi:hypothetical protein